jgi:hypothetical protein
VSLRAPVFRIAAGALLLSAACRAPRDPARACLEDAVAAAAKRDADGVMSHVADNFRDAEGGDRSDAAALVRRTLAAYENLSLSLSDVAVERGPAAAQAKFKVRMSGTPRTVAGLEGFLPRSSRWSFDVRLESLPAGWKIVSASWRRLEDGR